MFDKGIRKIRTVDKPVISIGNVTTGGTGKTPMVIWICKYLGEKGCKPGILTRGYKTVKGKLTDEPAILAKGCDKSKVIVNSNRFAGAEKAINQYECDVIVMDDGFQHRQFGRDVNIVTIDATCPFGYGKMLPAGFLREPVSSLKRADGVVITRFDQADAETLQRAEDQIRNVNPEAVIAKAIHAPINAGLLKNKKLSLDELREKKIFAFCGIGNPYAFMDMLEEIGLNVIGSKIYNDHHNYTSQDLQELYETARYLEVDTILSTQKDWVKTALLSLSEREIDFAYLAIELKFIEGQEQITRLIDEALQK